MLVTSVLVSAVTSACRRSLGSDQNRDHEDSDFKMLVDSLQPCSFTRTLRNEYIDYYYDEYSRKINHTIPGIFMEKSKKWNRFPPNAVDC